MFKEAKVLIVGAGASGFAAACRLLERGLQNIIILEAADRIGGRIHTVEFADNVIELGAEWVHGERGNISYELCSPKNILDPSTFLTDHSNWIFASSKGEIIPKKESVQLLDLYYHITCNLADYLKDFKGSYGEYFTKEYYKALKKNPFTDPVRADEFLKWIQKYENIIEGSESWSEISGAGMTEYWLCDGHPTLHWKGKGYKTLFDVLMHKFSARNEELPVLEKVQFNKVVSSIDYGNRNKIIVKTTDNSQYTTDHVIFTASLGVLKEQHRTLFTPCLPELKQRVIKGLGIGTVDKIFFEFPYAWWPKDIAGLNFVWSDEDKKEFLQSVDKDSEWLGEVFHFSTVDNQPRVLTGWLTGRWANYVEGLTDQVVLNGMHDVLQKFFGKFYTISKPERIIRSTWNRNKNFRGSYSYRSMESARLNVWAKDLAQPITDSYDKPIILFGGEATHDHYYSTVHGAVDSGFREADRLIEYYKKVSSRL